MFMAFLQGLGVVSADDRLGWKTLCCLTSGAFRQIMRPPRACPI
jgi:hypothetical protein